jgi:(p)ppGpp synthase/HD superfamily hydrolase
MIMNIVENALKIAIEAHEGVKRKFSDVAYIVHPIRCAEKAKSLGLSEVDQAAMLAHDVLEDTADVDLREQYRVRIEQECGLDVLGLVQELTFPCEGTEWHGRPRAEKNAIREPLMRKMSDRAKVLKMIDTLDNLKDYRNAPRKLLEKSKTDAKTRVSILGYAHEGLAKEILDTIQRV